MIRKPTAKELGAFIRWHRRFRGMTQAELGAAVGAHKSGINQYERGLVVPSASTWILIRSALDAPEFSRRVRTQENDDAD